MKCRSKQPYTYDCIQWKGDNYKEVCEFLGYEPETKYLNSLVSKVMEGSKLVDKEICLWDWMIIPDGIDSVDMLILRYYDFDDLYELEPKRKPIERCK